MRRAVLVISALALGVSAAAAVDVLLRDGTVIQATSYQITGSYLMVELPDGRKVAYAAADVDLEALRAQEAAARAAAAPEPTPGTRDTIAGALAAAGAESALTISDTDVAHVSPAGPESGEDKPKGPPPGYQEGGQVGLQGVKLNQVEPGVWEVQGEVVNRTGRSVGDVRVQLELISDVEGVLASADVPVTPVLEANLKASFTHRFPVNADKVPRLRGRVFWMQEEAAGQEQKPVQPGGAKGVVPGSAGGASSGGGAEARPTPRS
jgi:hypothetical protein